MFFTMILAVFVAQEVDGPHLDYPTLVSAIHQSDEIRDIGFLFEGTARFPGSDDPAEDEFSFQGHYLYRFKDSKRSSYLDVYMKKSDGSLEHRTHAILDDAAHRIAVHAPDSRPKPTKIDEFEATLGSLRIAGSPELVLYHQYFDRWDAENDGFARNVKFLGWETVHGSKCAHFLVDDLAGTAGEGKSYQEFWMDLTRGANVVKSRRYMFGHLGYEINVVSLDLVEAVGGGRYWLPMTVECSSFIHGVDDFREVPQVRVDFHIVRNSVAVNEDPPDDLFSVFRRPGLPRLTELEREYESQRGTRGPADFAAVQSHLESNLAEANRQSEELKASSPAKVSARWNALLTYGFVIIGIVLLLGAAASRIRGSTS